MRGGCRAPVLFLLVLGVSLWIATAGATASGWGLQRTPIPAGTQSIALNGVSCTAARACTAVGYHVNSAGRSLTLAERWDGKNWAIQRTPNPAGATQSYLSGVSCTAARACTAVGDYTNGAGRKLTLAERWDGKNWAIQRTPNPAGATQSYVNGVSCTTSRACIAVGTSYDSAYHSVTLAERWDGKNWAIQRTPKPAGTQNIALNGVSCTAARACTGVGYQTYGAGRTLTLAERWNGKNWAIQRTPKSAGTQNIALNGVSCTATRACTAVGQSPPNSTGQPMTLAERWDGKTWTIQRTPNPAGAANGGLNGVSCTAARACTAVGTAYYTNGAGRKLTLAERWNGKNWAIQRTPNPAGATYSYVDGVSCTTRGACIAVGAQNRAGRPMTLVERHS